jgi:hypothetical protein
MREELLFTFRRSTAIRGVRSGPSNHPLKPVIEKNLDPLDWASVTLESQRCMTWMLLNKYGDFPVDVLTFPSGCTSKRAI